MCAWFSWTRIKYSGQQWPYFWAKLGVWENRLLSFMSAKLWWHRIQHIYVINWRSFSFIVSHTLHVERIEQSGQIQQRHLREESLELWEEISADPLKVILEHGILTYVGYLFNNCMVACLSQKLNLFVCSVWTKTAKVVSCQIITFTSA